ncbi:MAG: cytochrome c, partial [Bacteroidia bacterium]|nr:cytochrome c [Bacteroidia bacterium]
MKLSLSISLFLFVLFSLLACNGNEKSEQKKVESKSESKKVDDEAAAIFKSGQKLYIQHCSACHMPKGDGIPGLNPPLINTDWVTGDKTRLVNIVINGLEEPIEVNGQKYQGPMIGLPYLKDKEIAHILTYIRSRFGKGASSVTEEEVKAIRGSAS